jgi:hypothetical protein
MVNSMPQCEHPNTNWYSLASLFYLPNSSASKQWHWYYNPISLLVWFGFKLNSIPRLPIWASKRSLSHQTSNDGTISMHFAPTSY